MMDEVKGLSAGMRFALTRQLAARCVVLMAYVLAGYCVPWLWGLILALVSGGHYVVEYHVLGPTLVMCAVLTAVPAVSGFRSLYIHGRGPGRVFLDRDVRQSLLLPCLLGGHDVGVRADAEP